MIANQNRAYYWKSVFDNFSTFIVFLPYVAKQCRTKYWKSDILMKTSNELHLLVRSMSMSEKRFFKIHSARHIIGKTNNYMRLFDAIALQDEYHEEEIRKKFERDIFIRHLPSEKHYLYNHVLESLNSFHKEKTFLSRYSNVLISIEILYNRGLFGQCRKLILRSKKEAYSLEKFSILLLLLRWETLIHIKDEDDAKLNRNISEELRVLEVMRIQYQLMQIAFNVQIQIDKGNFNPGFMRKAERDLRANLPIEALHNSFWAKYYYHSTIGLIASVEKKHMLRYNSYKEIKRLMDISPQFIIDLPGIYHLNTNNLVSMMLLLKKYNEAGALIRHQRSFMHENKIKRPALSKLIFINTNECEIFLLYKTGKFNEASQVVRQIENEIKKIDFAFSPTLFDLFFFMAVAELMVKNYKNAARWLNKILHHEKEIGLRRELQLNARLLYLIVLLESRDVLFENRMKAAKRFFSKEKKHGVHHKIAEVIRLLADENLRKKNEVQLKKYSAEIRMELKDASDEAIYRQFDFSGWIEKEL